MALPPAIMSMITVTNTMAWILGKIKSRFRSIKAISDAACNCTQLVKKIHRLLKRLGGAAHVPNETTEISTALSIRREEFEAVLKKLKNLNRRTHRTNLIGQAEKFIMAQVWAKEMEALHNDLVQVRNGVETIVTSWGSAQFVLMRVQKEFSTLDGPKETKQEWRQERTQQRKKKGSIGVTNKLTKRDESARQRKKRKQHGKCKRFPNTTNSMKRNESAEPWKRRKMQPESQRFFATTYVPKKKESGRPLRRPNQYSKGRRLSMTMDVPKQKKPGRPQEKLKRHGDIHRKSVAKVGTKKKKSGTAQRRRNDKPEAKNARKKKGNRTPPPGSRHILVTTDGVKRNRSRNPSSEQVFVLTSETKNKKSKRRPRRRRQRSKRGMVG